MNNHVATSCISSICNGLRVPLNVSYTAHYRYKVQGCWKSVGLVEDKTIWKFRDKLIESVEKTLKDLQFVP
jgi:hypothetical protein